MKPDKATRSNEEITAIMKDDLSTLIQDNYEFTEVIRQPLDADFNNILGHPFHWIAEFPEIASKNPSGEYTVSFDIIIGNPPYGDLLSESEKLLINGFGESLDCVRIGI